MKRLVKVIGELSRLSGKGCKLVRSGSVMGNYTLRHEDITFEDFSVSELGDLVGEYLTGRYGAKIEEN